MTPIYTIFFWHKIWKLMYLFITKQAWTLSYSWFEWVFCQINSNLSEDKHSFSLPLGLGFVGNNFIISSIAIFPKLWFYPNNFLRCLSRHMLTYLFVGFSCNMCHKWNMSNFNASLIKIQTPCCETWVQQLIKCINCIKKCLV